MAASDKLTGGELDIAVTRALVGTQNEYLGRGPKKASTVHYDNVVVTIMNDILIPADRAIRALGARAQVGDDRSVADGTSVTGILKSSVWCRVGCRKPQQAPVAAAAPSPQPSAEMACEETRQYGLTVCPACGVEEAGSPMLFVG